MRIASVLVVAALLSSSPASAESWYEGEQGRQRIVNLAVTGGVGLTVLASVAFRDSIQPSACRWCTPPGFDASVRNALVWDDIGTARRISDVGVVGLTFAGVGLALVPVVADGGGWGEMLDATLPVAGSIAVNQAITQIAKLAAGRARPHVHFAENPVPPHAEDNVSFFSGHSSLAFAAATSTAMVVRQRGSRYEPAVWAVGLTLASAVGYFRIAGDKHYFSDVLLGAVVGTATGLVVPQLMEHEMTASTDARTVSIGGSF